MIKRVRKNGSLLLRGIVDPAGFWASGALKQALVKKTYPAWEVVRQNLANGYGTFNPINGNDNIQNELLLKYRLDPNNPANDTDYHQKLHAVSTAYNMTHADWKDLLQKFKTGVYPFDKIQESQRIISNNNLEYVVSQLLNTPSIIDEYMRVRRGGVIPVQNTNTTSNVAASVAKTNVDTVSPISTTTQPVKAGVNYILIAALLVGGYFLTKSKKKNVRRK